MTINLEYLIEQHNLLKEHPFRLGNDEKYLGNYAKEFQSFYKNVYEYMKKGKSYTEAYNNDKESLTMFKEGGRQDLVDATNTEIKILEEFLPKQLTSEEIHNTILEEIKKNNYNSIKDMGKLMSFFKLNYSGQCDMGLVSITIKEILK